METGYADDDISVIGNLAPTRGEIGLDERVELQRRYIMTENETVALCTADGATLLGMHGMQQRVGIGTVIDAERDAFINLEAMLPEHVGDRRVDIETETDEEMLL